MRTTFLALLMLMIGPAFADELSGDDVGYGRPTPSNPCACAPGGDGIDWNGDGLSNSGDAAYAPAGAYLAGTAWGGSAPGDFRPFGAQGEAGPNQTGMGGDRGHGTDHRDGD
jgi:hypothetical protein